MNHIEQVVAEVEARRLAAQTVVDECESMLAGLRKMLQPALPGLEAPAKRRYPKRVSRGDLRHGGPRTGNLKAAAARRAAIVALMADGCVRSVKEIVGEVPTAKGVSAREHYKAISNSVAVLDRSGQLRHEGRGSWVAVA